MAEMCPKKVKIQHFSPLVAIILHYLVGRRPTSDLFHMLACAWPLSGYGARIYWGVAPINSSRLIFGIY